MVGRNPPEPRGRNAAQRLQVLEAEVRALTEQAKTVGEERDRLQRRVSELEGTEKAQRAELEAGATTLRQALADIEGLRSQIDSRVAAGEARVRELEAALAEARKAPARPRGGGEGQRAVDGLIEENRRLAEQVATLSKESAATRRAATSAQTRVEAARAEAERRVRAELAGGLAAAEAQRDALQAQLEIATRQLRAQGKAPALPAERVAGMLNDLVEKMQAGFEGMRVRDGEVRLRVGIEGSGGAAGFVIPSADTAAEVRESLQEFTFRFDRSGEAS